MTMTVTGCNLKKERMDFIIWQKGRGGKQKEQNSKFLYKSIHTR